MKCESYLDTEPLQIKLLEWAKKVKDKKQDIKPLMSIVAMLEDHDLLRYNVERRIFKLADLKMKEETIKESVRFKLEQEDFVTPNILPFDKEWRTYLKTTFKVSLREYAETLKPQNQ